MNRLSKKQIREKAGHESAISSAHQDLDAAVQEYNATVCRAHEVLAEKYTAYTGAIERANEWRESVREEAQEYYDERSDAWRKGDKGQAYSEWLGALDTEFEVPEDLDEPEELEVPEDDASNAVADLPEEPS